MVKRFTFVYSFLCCLCIEQKCDGPFTLKKVVSFESSLVSMPVVYFLCQTSIKSTKMGPCYVAMWRPSRSEKLQFPKTTFWWVHGHTCPTRNWSGATCMYVHCFLIRLFSSQTEKVCGSEELLKGMGFWKTWNCSRQLSPLPARHMHFTPYNLSAETLIALRKSRNISGGKNSKQVYEVCPYFPLRQTASSYQHDTYWWQCSCGFSTIHARF